MATRTAAPGLSTDELARIRDTLAAGRKPKVVFTASAGQIAGQVGQVVELTDPDLSDEWVVVRFGNDELPFSPADLQLPVRAKPSVRATALPAPLPGPREEPSVPSPSTAPLNGAARPAKAAKPAAAERAKPAAEKPAADASPAAPPAQAPASVPAKVSAPAKAAAAVPADTPTEKVTEKPAATAPDAPPVKAPARKAAKPKAPPSLTVTLTYAEGEWMVGATQGSKALAKPYVIKPSEALKMVSMLDVPGVHEAVDDIVSAARAEA
jgi:hypothetical protein